MNLLGALKENKLYILMAALLMGIFMVIGAMTPLQEGSLADSPLLKNLEPYLQYYQPFNPITVIFLFLKNSLTAGMAFILGPLLLLFPAIVLVLNGFLVGYVGNSVANQLSIQMAFATLAPHGIFELPALVIASAAGFHLGVATLEKAYATLRHRDYSFYFEFNSALRLFVITIILLAIAAIMETFVTPIFIEFFRP